MHPALLPDLDSLRELASEPVLRRGLAYARDHRVTELRWTDETVRALVEGTRNGWPYAVEVAVDDDNELAVTCDCPYDAEPMCKHAVATLVVLGEQVNADSQARDAAEAAVQARAQRARTEVAVEPLDGKPGFGRWRARSLGRDGRTGQPREVLLRSVERHGNACECPDFAVNQLGTCKHIEAVLHKLRTRHKSTYARMAADGLPGVRIVASWEGPGEGRIRRIGAGARGAADACFDSQGWLRGALPEAFFTLERALSGHPSAVIDEDARELARGHAERAQAELRRQRIAAEIRHSGGHLPGVRARLFPYQVEGVALLAGAGRALLADDMGLGKTLQAIAAASVLARTDDVARTIIVCPASLKRQWAREIKKFLGDEAVVVEGSADARRVLYHRRARFTIVNYELLLRDQEVVGSDLAPDLLILDEAQRIKNWRTRQADAVKRLSTRFAFVLTGTPLENRLEDLYSLMQVVDNRLLGPLWRFLVDFHVTSETGTVLGYRNLGELRRRLKPVMLRRDRSLVADQLPARTQQRLDIDLSARQRSLHDAAMQSAASIAVIAQRRPLTPSEEHRLLAALQSARMACNAAGLVDKETQGSPKLDELRRILEELCVDGGQKVVVFSEWERMTAMAEEVAQALSLGSVRLHGGVPTQRRQALIDRFHEDPACQVFFSTDAGGVGLNLQCATTLINLDLPFNPGRLDQRVARIHRLGQRQSVQVLLLVAAHSYEASVSVLLTGKRDLFFHAVHEDGSAEVVGVSRKAVQAALDSVAAHGGEAVASEGEGALEADSASEADALAVDGSLDVEEQAAESVPDPAPEAEPNTSIWLGTATSADGDPATLALDALHRALGTRIERVVAAQGGLVAIVDAVDATAESAAAACSDAVRVVVVDRRTWAALETIGSAPTGPALFSRPNAEDSEMAAHRKLRGARALLDQGCEGEAAGLAIDAALLALAHRAGVTPPPRAEAPLWVFGQLVGAGVLRADAAVRLGAAFALAERGVDGAGVLRACEEVVGAAA